MNTFVERMKRIEQRVSEQYGPFELFALFRPDTTLRLWDILISAKWIEEDRLASMRIIAEQMNQEFSITEIVQFSGFVIIEHDYEGLRQFQSEVNIEHGVKEFRNVTFFDVPILHAYVITSHHKILQDAFA